MSQLVWKPGFLPSNGTQGEWFRSYTCYTCVADHGWHDAEPAEDESCPILLAALCSVGTDGPTEWEGVWVGQIEHARCAAWKPCACADGSDTGSTFGGAA